MRSSRLLMVPLLAALAGCGATATMDGPQLASPPPGMGLMLNCQAARLPIASHPLYIQRCYAEAGRESTGWITISQYEGAASETELREQHVEYVEHWTQGNATFSDLEATTVDGQPAWYRFEYEDGKPVACTVMLSYDDACFSVEFDTHAPAWQDETRLRDTVCSFTRTRPGSVSTPLVATLVVAGIAGLGFWFVRRRKAEEEAARLAAETRARYEARKQQPGGGAPPAGGGAS